MKTKITLYALLCMSSIILSMDKMPDENNFGIAQKQTLALLPSPQSSLNNSTEVPQNLSDDTEKEKRRAQIRKNLEPLADQIKEADSAQRALAMLRASGSGSHSPLGSSASGSTHSSSSASPLSISGSSSQNESNSDDIKKAAAEILSGSGHHQKLPINLTYADETTILSRSTEPTTDNRESSDSSVKPSEGTLKHLLPSEQPDNQPAQPYSTETTKDTLILEKQKIENTDPLESKTFIQKHPLLSTITGVGITVAALIVLLHHMDKLPDNMQQILTACMSKLGTEL